MVHTKFVHTMVHRTQKTQTYLSKHA